jgi:lipoprotein signal peptidase
MYNRILNDQNNFIVLCLFFTNAIFSLFVRQNSQWYVRNYEQEFFRFGWLGVFIVVLLMALLIYRLKIYNKYPILFLILAIGLISNIFEKIIFGFVADYLNFGIGIANFADLQIYVTAALLSFKELFDKSNQ